MITLVISYAKIGIHFKCNLTLEEILSHYCFKSRKLSISIKSHPVEDVRQTHVQQRSFHNLPELLNLLLTASYITVCYIWLFFNLHHGHCGVYLWWQGDVDLILVPVYSVNVMRTNYFLQERINSLI